MVEQRHVPVALAAGRGIAAAKACFRAVGPVDELRSQRGMPIAAVPRSKAWSAMDCDTGDRRLDADLDRIARDVGRGLCWGRLGVLVIGIGG